MKVLLVDSNSEKCESFESFPSTACSIAIGDTSCLVEEAVFLAGEKMI
jgi:hypothetical protein